MVKRDKKGREGEKGWPCLPSEPGRVEARRKDAIRAAPEPGAERRAMLAEYVSPGPAVTGSRGGVLLCRRQLRWYREGKTSSLDGTGFSF
jgi:hypothetical protein